MQYSIMNNADIAVSASRPTNPAPNLSRYAGNQFQAYDHASYRLVGSETQPDGRDAVPRLSNALADLSAWYGRDPGRHAVISSLALTVDYTNRGKQKEVRALIHLANEQVYFISVIHSSAEIGLLLESVGLALISCWTKTISIRALEAQVSDRTDCNVIILDDHPKQTSSWKLECWRRHRSCGLARDKGQLTFSEIADRVGEDLTEMESMLSVGLDRLMASLDQIILQEINQPDVFSCRRYNYLAQPDPIVRRNRQQAAVVFPLLVGEILNSSESKPLTTQMGVVIDSGQKLVDWISKTFSVRPAVAKALRHLSENTVGENWRGKLQSLLFLLSNLPPERYPKTISEWQALNEATQFIRATTGHPVCSTSTGMLLGDIARKNWQMNKVSSASMTDRARCIEAFIRKLSNSLAAYIKVEMLGTQGHPLAQAQAVASNELVSIGIRRIEMLAVKWQSLSRDTDYISGHESNDALFPVLLPDSYADGDLTIVQLASQVDLTRESVLLGHCVKTYGATCHRGQSVMFSVRNNHGQPRSTFEVILRTLSLSACEVDLIQHKARGNASPSREDKLAVSGFLKFLKRPEALPLVMRFSKEKMLACVEPTLSGDYRSALLMSTFLMNATHGRIKFDELVARIVSPLTPSVRVGDIPNISGNER